MANNNNDFPNHDISEPDFSQFDQVGDFDEFGDTGAKKENSFSNFTASPFAKVLMVAAAILVIVMAITLFGGKSKPPELSDTGSGSEVKQAPGQGQQTQAMVSAIEEKNNQDLQAAIQGGTSSMPTPVTPPKDLLGAPQSPDSEEDPLLRWKRLQEERQRLQQQQQQLAAQAQVDPKRGERVTNLQQAMMTQVGTIMGERGIKDMQNVKVTSKDKMGQVENGTATDQNGTVNPHAGNNTSLYPDANYQQAQLTPPKILIPAGEINYAQLLMEANSDIPGPILGLLVSGKYSGSRVIGSFQRQEEYLVLKFSTLIDKKGRSIPIEAYAVDPDTTLTGMATDVDHRYFRRIIIPAAVKFIEGMGQAVAQNGSTTVSVDSGGGTVSQQNNDLDTKQEFSKAVEEAANKVGDVLDKDSDVEILVRVKAGTPMGILFVQQVTDQSINGANGGLYNNGYNNVNYNQQLNSTPYPQQPGFYNQGAPGYNLNNPNQATQLYQSGYNGNPNTQLYGQQQYGLAPSMGYGSLYTPYGSTTTTTNTTSSNKSK